jgi:hypothetical protein
MDMANSNASYQVKGKKRFDPRLERPLIQCTLIASGESTIVGR